MGLRFPIQFANIVGHLTWSQSLPQPRVIPEDLIDFYRFLSKAAEYGEVEESSAKILFSKNIIWRKKVSEAVQKELFFLNRSKIFSGLPLRIPVTRGFKSKLKNLFSDFLLSCLFICTREDAKNIGISLDENFKFLSESSEEILFLLPDGLDDFSEAINILDPFPAFEKVAKFPERLPGVLFWTPEGQTAFSPLEEAVEFLNNLIKLDSLEDFTIKEGLMKLEKTVERIFPSTTPKTILHLSDLHFGKKTAIRNQEYLLSHLHTVIPETNRIIITGDLFDSPVDNAKQLFANFHSSLHRLSGKEPLIIPGNHDRRVLGNFALNSFLKSYLNLNWSKLIEIDDEIKCVFFCLNSAREGTFARGNISDDQMRELAILYNNQVICNRNLDGYLRIALIHHHPIPFEEGEEIVSRPPKTFLKKLVKMIPLADIDSIWRLFGYFGIRQEHFLSLSNSEDFLQWCADRNIALLLHGHKHLQRHAVKFLSSKTTDSYSQLNAIGCGTSLGAGGYPLTYNILNWNDTTKRWTTTFYADNNYGGFTPQSITIKQVN